MLIELHQYFETQYLQYRKRSDEAIGGYSEKISPNVVVPFGRNKQGSDREPTFRLQRGNKMVNLELSDQELLILTETLQSFLSDLSYEISNTALHDYREQLKARRAVLEKIKNELEQA